MPVVGTVKVVRKNRKFSKLNTVKKKMREVIRSEVATHFISKFNDIVNNWEHKPEFNSKPTVSSDIIAIAIYPVGENKDIWKFVSGGTKEHLIFPKRAKSLRFVGGGVYIPKTAKGVYGGPGIVRGGEVIYAKAVKHPGNEAREFEKYVKDSEAKWFSDTMENVFKRIIKSL